MPAVRRPMIRINQPTAATAGSQMLQPVFRGHHMTQRPRGGVQQINGRASFNSSQRVPGLYFREISRNM